ncbi:helix-turn-helix transcriptional regulator [Amycolatopsis sulphurea]|nr:helix-turn-helix transcriptional regulator [Amycolatopsis sulphurea]
MSRNGGGGVGRRRDELAARREAMGFTQESLAIRLGVELSTVGRWERGTLIPQPWRRHRIAELLNVSLEQLNEFLTATDDTVVDIGGVQATATHTTIKTTPWLDRALVLDDARDAARFARQVDASRVSSTTLERITIEIRRFASDYVSQPLSELFVDIRELRAEVFRLVQGNRSPVQMRELYLSASRLSGLQAHICLDLGHYRAAQTQAHTSFICAELAGHNGMLAWVHGLQSLIAFWDGQLLDAVEFARDGARYCSHGSIAARLPSLEARASASRGDKRSALAALTRARQARTFAGTEDDVGVFTFPEAKQAVYAGTTLLTVGDEDSIPNAVQESSHALSLYEAATPADRSSGDILAARLDIGRAYLMQSDVDGLADQLRFVLDVPQVRRTASIVKRAASIGEALAGPRYSDSPQTRRLRDEIASFCASPPALPPA